MFGFEEEKKTIKKKEPKICPLLKMECGSKCAWAIEDEEEFICSITRIALNT